MNMENIKTAFADAAFVKELFALETVAEALAALKEKGVEMTEKEFITIREGLKKAAAGEITAEQLENGELPEELLEQVAGGSLLLTLGVVAAGISSLGSMLFSIFG